MGGNCSIVFNIPGMPGIADNVSCFIFGRSSKKGAGSKGVGGGGGGCNLFAGLKGFNGIAGFFERVCAYDERPKQITAKAVNDDLSFIASVLC